MKKLVLCVLALFLVSCGCRGDDCLEKKEDNQCKRCKGHVECPN